MKIGLDITRKSISKTQTERIIDALAKYAPQHQYTSDSKQYATIDIYHGFGCYVPFMVRFRGIRSVVTVHNLNFVHYPHAYIGLDRMFRMWMYKKSCRYADRIIAVNNRVGEDVSRILKIDDAKIEVMMPITTFKQTERPNGAICEVLRKKYSLPDRYVLMLGATDPRHNQKNVIDVMRFVESDCDLIICGRRSGYTDHLLEYARQHHFAKRLNFIYEYPPEDMAGLLLLSQVFVFIPHPDVEVSIRPMVEALRVGTPMILSGTPLNREVAEDAAVYVRDDSADELAVALETVLYDTAFRDKIVEKEMVRAEFFSDHSVARRLTDIYASL